jgi:hypothetical protein
MLNFGIQVNVAPAPARAREQRPFLATFCPDRLLANNKRGGLSSKSEAIASSSICQIKLTLKLSGGARAVANT